MKGKELTISFQHHHLAFNIMIAILQALLSLDPSVRSVLIFGLGLLVQQMPSFESLLDCVKTSV
jgi:hypothetical protein